MSTHDRADDLRARLRALRTAATRREEALRGGLDAIVASTRDVATDDEHDPEGHTIAWERQQLAALLREARSALTAIEAALQRVDDRLYGICTSCGCGISEERLEALPATPTCLLCAHAPVP